MLPLFGWLASRVARRRTAVGLRVFRRQPAAVRRCFSALAGKPLGGAQFFYIRLSVFNPVAISLAWSVLADVFSTTQAKRLFGMIAGGAVAWAGSPGPGWGRCWWRRWAMSASLMLAALLSRRASAGAGVWLYRWRDRNPLPAGSTSGRRKPPGAASGGNPFEGAAEVARTPFLDRHRRVRGAAGQRQHLSLLRAGAAGGGAPPGPHPTRPRCSA